MMMEKSYYVKRHHQALDYKTPLQFLNDNGIIQEDKPEVVR